MATAALATTHCTGDVLPSASLVTELGHPEATESRGANGIVVGALRGGLCGALFFVPLALFDDDTAIGLLFFTTPPAVVAGALLGGIGGAVASTLISRGSTRLSVLLSTALIPSLAYVAMCLVGTSLAHARVTPTGTVLIAGPAVVGSLFMLWTGNTLWVRSRLGARQGSV